MSIEAMKQALELLRKKEWEACDYTSNAREAAELLEQAIATAVTESHKESSATQEPKREPLTDKELDDICLKSKSFQHGMRLVEAAHGIIHNYPEKDNS